MERTDNLNLWFAGKITYADLTPDEQYYVDYNCLSNDELDEKYPEKFQPLSDARMEEIFGGPETAMGDNLYNNPYWDPTGQDSFD